MNTQNTRHRLYSTLFALLCFAYGSVGVYMAARKMWQHGSDPTLFAGLFLLVLLLVLVIAMGGVGIWATWFDRADTLEQSAGEPK